MRGQQEPLTSGNSMTKPHEDPCIDIGRRRTHDGHLRSRVKSLLQHSHWCVLDDHHYSLYCKASVSQQGLQHIIDLILRRNKIHVKQSRDGPHPASALPRITQNSHPSPQHAKLACVALPRQQDTPDWETRGRVKWSNSVFGGQVAGMTVEPLNKR